MYVEMKNIFKQYGNFRASDNVNFGIEKGKLVALLGPSGSGKTTILRMIAGLETPSFGDIYIDGKRVNDVPANQREIGFVFQNYALFRHMTVYDNIAFGLKLKKVPKDEIKKRVTELLDITGLAGLEKRYPNQLSGGQRQRVMIAMAFINNPALLIADEPTTALDVTIQTQIMDLMRQMNKKTNTAILLISHELGVVSRLCSRVYIMYAGRIVESGPVDQILSDPLHPYTKGLVEAIPDITKRGKPLKAIPGSVPGLYARSNTGCGFAERCEYCTNKCQKEVPLLVQDGGRAVACWNKNFDSGRGNTHD